MTKQWICLLVMRIYFNPLTAIMLWSMVSCIQESFVYN